MIWVEIVCDGCNNNPCGEAYRKGSITRLKEEVKTYGWKTVKGKIYCLDCQKELRNKGE